MKCFRLSLARLIAGPKYWDAFRYAAADYMVSSDGGTIAEALAHLDGFAKNLVNSDSITYVQKVINAERWKVFERKEDCSS
jgi:hypothetical protein